MSDISLIFPMKFFFSFWRNLHYWRFVFFITHQYLRLYWLSSFAGCSTQAINYIDRSSPVDHSSNLHRYPWIISSGHVFTTFLIDQVCLIKSGITISHNDKFNERWMSWDNSIWIFLFHYEEKSIWKNNGFFCFDE